MRTKTGHCARALAAAVFFMTGTVVAPFADAACNLIPPAEQAFPSTTGSITSPVTTEGEQVELRLTSCDASIGFDPNPANNQVALAFLPAGLGQPPPVIVSSLAITVSDCAGALSPLCTTLRFTMPSTPTLAGPAAITVTVGATTVAQIDQLFQPHALGSTCDQGPEGIFQVFTVLPAPNDFFDVATGGVTQIRATLDGGGNFLLPFDYRQVLPLGPGAPVARLLTGTTTLDAFPLTPGFQPVDVPTSYVRSFTIDGRPLPPLLRATDAGNQIFGATDGAVAFIRVAASGDQGVKFDLQSLRTNGGYGPIVIADSEYSFSTNAAVPLENLHSTEAGVSFARDESIEGISLNASSGDADTADKVVQVVEVATFASTNTEMAASPTNNPIVGGAALDVSSELAAFFESEAAQNATDLNLDGDTIDHILRVFTVAGSQIAPATSFLGNPFPGVNRKPLAIGGLNVFYREPQPGLIGGPGLSAGGLDMAVSPDGRYLYDVAAGVITGFLGVFRRDPETGGEQREHTPVHLQGTLDGATGITVSPNSRFLFIAVKGHDALESIEVRYDPIGKATLLRHGGSNRQEQGDPGVDGLTGVTQVAAAPDGAHVYAVADGDDAVTAFSVNPVQGAMGFVQALKNGVGVMNMADPIQVVVSGDGKNVYVAARGSNALHAFSRNTLTGVLTPLQALLDGGGGGPSLGGIRDVAVSPDGRHVYATSDTDSALTIFGRNLVTGSLTFLQALVNGIGGIPDLDGGKGVIVSPDNAAVYVSTAFGHLLVFTRNLPGDTLTYVESVGPNFGVPLETGHLAISPDSEHVYQAFNAGGLISSYTRRGTLRAFDALSGTLKPGLGANQASLAAVGGRFAAFISPLGAQLYDADTDSATPIGSGLFPSKLAMSSTLIAMIVAEGSLGVDGNRDGDQNDGVLVVATTANPSVHKVVPIETEALGVTDLCMGGNDGLPCSSDVDCGGGTCRGLVVLGSNEFRYKDSGEHPNPPSADFNGNDDVTNVLVLFVYDHGSGRLKNIGWQSFDFEVGGRLAPFRTAETEHDVDLNDNGTMTDTVMMVYDIARGVVLNPKAAVVKCELPGCEPGLPYKIRGDSVAFLTPEPAQLADLDGDGLQTHTVVQIYTVTSAVRQVLAAVDSVGSLPATFTPLGGIPPLLPTTFANGTIIFKQAKESDLGKDINEDFDLDDVVTLVEGDSDGDGVFDGQDVCGEVPDAEQRDSDADALPDACDPNPYCGTVVPAVPSIPPSAALACQKAVGKAVAKLFTAQLGATRGCLDSIAGGRLDGEPTLLCRGGLVNDVPVLPGDPKTSAKIARAVARVASAATLKCPDLSQIGACATTSDGLAACAATEASATIPLLSALDYGQVEGIVDPDARRCQKTIGRASGQYLAAVLRAMGGCLDKLHAGQLSGSGDTLCLGGGTSGGVTLPTDPRTAMKLQQAADLLQSAISKACPGATAAALDACGTDAVSLTGCIRCTHGRAAIAAMRAAYGPP